jgi:succinyl-diaminopimelate desuccinylase
VQIVTPSGLLEMARPYQADAIGLLRDLVRIPSVNGIHGETRVARRVLEEAERLGLRARLAGLEQDRQNVVVEVGRGGRGFALIGHLDTVAEGETQTWSHPPFGAEVSGSRMYARGAADNKAGIACGLYALAMLIDHALIDPAQSRAVLAGVVDEESGASSTLGVRHLLQQGELPVEAAIYTYASDVICIGHRGLVRLVLRAEGQAVHSGSPEWDDGSRGVNAVTGLAEVLLGLEDVVLQPASHPAFDGLSNKVTAGTLVRGGDWQGMVPAWAEATVDVRLLPGCSPESVMEACRAVMCAVEDRRPGLKVRMEQTVNLPAAVIPSDHRLVELARRATQTITGQAWPVVGAGPANEGYMLIQAGIPTLCGFGPRGGNPHAPDEWADLDSIVPTIAMFAEIVRDYLAEEEP